MVSVLKKEAIIRGIKIVDIGFITVIYFALGYSLAFVVDNWIAKMFSETADENKSKWRLIGEILFQVIIIGILTYIMRNLVELIPFPLNGILGYDHMRVKELKSGALFTVFVVMFSYNMQDKLLKLREKLTKKPAVTTP